MKVLIALVVMVVVCSCGEENSAQKTQPSSQQSPTLFDAQIEALEKAKDVEDSLEQMKEAREQQMRDQGI